MSSPTIRSSVRATICHYAASNYHANIFIHAISSISQRPCRFGQMPITRVCSDFERTCPTFEHKVDVSGGPVYDSSLFTRNHSYIKTLPATATLSDSTLPVIGSRAHPSICARTASDIPRTSCPKTMATRPFQLS